MALRDWIIDSERVATATAATIATVDLFFPKKEQTVAITDNENAESEGLDEKKNSAHIPLICFGCGQLEVVTILEKDVPGCLYTAISEYHDGWKRLPDGIERCSFPGMRSPVKNEDQ